MATTVDKGFFSFGSAINLGNEQFSRCPNSQTLVESSVLTIGITGKLANQGRWLEVGHMGGIVRPRLNMALWV